MARMAKCCYASVCRSSESLLQLSSSSSSMSAEAHTNPHKTQPETAPKTLENYPVPLSPPPPLISKSLELNRALTASSKSPLFSLCRKDVLFEDEWLLAVNKPQGIYCENVLSSVATLLNADQGDKEKLQELHLSNRLDRDTSGVTLITKSHKVAAKLVKAFTDHKIKKTYLAFCIGTAPIRENITIKSGHGRSRHGAWRVYACSDVGCSLPGCSVVRDMETLFEVISINRKGCLKELSTSKTNSEVLMVEGKSEIASHIEKDEVLVRAYPKSGRTHQIRLHCQYLGIPIRGDVKYEGVYEWDGRVYEGHELHAESLSFDHPITGQSVLIRAPLPLWATQALEHMSS